MPAIRVGGKLVTTVLDLALAQYGIGRPGLPGAWPSGYEDAQTPGTPAWQQPITGVDGRLAAKVAREFAREFARNAEVTEGRSMICMGAGTNHWFHSDQAPEGKLDLMTTVDFRMTSNALFSDVVLPAATWYEKYDLSSTDLHPFVHAFNEAIAPQNISGYYSQRHTLIAAELVQE